MEILYSLDEQSSPELNYPEHLSWENRIKVFELQNFESHIEPDIDNRGNTIQIGGGANFLIVNYWKFSHFKVYIFCGIGQHINPYNTKTCRYN